MAPQQPPRCEFDTFGKATGAPFPLVALYPALIVGSGLWFRVSLVRLTTQLCALGYASLLATEYWRLGSLQHPHWHFIFLAVLALVGFVVAYHVHRVSVLGRLCDSRPSG